MKHGLNTDQAEGKKVVSLELSSVFLTLNNRSSELNQEHLSNLTNIFADIPTLLTEELFQTIFTLPGLRVERIVSHGQCSPEGFWYDQELHELVILLTGAARLRFENDESAIELTPGAIVNIPAHQRHRVDWTDPTQPTIWLAIHCDTSSSPNRAVRPLIVPTESSAEISNSN